MVRRPLTLYRPLCKKACTITCYLIRPCLRKIEQASFAWKKMRRQSSQQSWNELQMRLRGRAEMNIEFCTWVIKDPQDMTTTFSNWIFSQEILIMVIMINGMGTGPMKKFSTLPGFIFIILSTGVYCDRFQTLSCSIQMIILWIFRLNSTSALKKKLKYWFTERVVSLT